MGLCRQRTFKKRRLPTKLRREHSLRTALLTIAQRAKTAYTQKTAPKTALTKQKKCHEFCTTYAKIRDINNFKFNLPHVPKEGGETPFLPRERFRANAERALAKRGIHSAAPSAMSPQGANGYRHGCMKLPVQTALRTAPTALATRTGQHPLA